MQTQLNALSTSDPYSHLGLYSLDKIPDLPHGWFNSYGEEKTMSLKGTEFRLINCGVRKFNTISTELCRSELLHVTLLILHSP